MANPTYSKTLIMRPSLGLKEIGLTSEVVSLARQSENRKLENREYVVFMSKWS